METVNMGYKYRQAVTDDLTVDLLYYL